MQRKYFLSLVLCLVTISWSLGQELNFSVKINIQKLQSVDPQVFSTLENTLMEFINNTQWTDDSYEDYERIEGNLLLTIQEEISPTRFKATMAIQSSRPIYGSDAKSLMLNHIDNEVTFDYQQYDPIQFSLNNFQGNLSSVLSFYIYVIIGMDYDSFSPFGGERYFQMAQDILNNVPQNLLDQDVGWSSLKTDNNRFWIIENILSPRVRPYRQTLYDYHRQSLDIMGNDVDTGRKIMADAINNLVQVNQAYPNTIILRMFVNSKSEEIIEIFKRGTRQEKEQVIQALSKIDASNASKYRTIR